MKRREGALLEPGLHWALGKQQLARLQEAGGHWQTYCHLFLASCPSPWVSSLHCLLSSCLAASCPALLPVCTSLLTQAGLDTEQVGGRRTGQKLDERKHVFHMFISSLFL